MLTKRRALHLDDDPSMQRLVATVLRHARFRVSTYLTGWEAIAALNTTDFDVILLDLMMPHEGGVTVIRHLRKSAPPMLQRVILVTASPDSIIKPLEKEVGAVVKKPFEPEELLWAVERVVA